MKVDLAYSALDAIESSTRPLFRQTPKSLPIMSLSIMSLPIMSLPIGSRTLSIAQAHGDRRVRDLAAATL